MMTLPTNHLELFNQFIEAQRCILGEFLYDWMNKYRLRSWARKYAISKGLSLRNGDEYFGIYSEPLPKEVEELKKEGIWE